MSVLIKGLKMPEKCNECWFCVDGEYCEAINEYFHEKPKSCPLVELPDHGDLIDRDELLKSSVPFVTASFGCSQEFIAKGNITNAAAVIKAERMTE